MLHALGIGTLWDEYGLIGKSCQYRDNSRASQEFRAASGCNFAVPVNQGDCAHWSRSCFGGSELMGPVESSLSRLSRITLGSLEDMGYSVDYNQAENINKFTFASECQCNRRLGGNSTFIEEPERRLSNAGLAFAQNYGLAVLAQNEAAIEEEISQTLIPNDDLIDIGGHVISVMYEEDGVAYDVVVRSDNSTSISRLNKLKL